MIVVRSCRTPGRVFSYWLPLVLYAFSVSFLPGKTRKTTFVRWEFEPWERCSVCFAQWFIFCKRTYTGRYDTSARPVPGIYRAMLLLKQLYWAGIRTLMRTSKYIIVCQVWHDLRLARTHLPLPGFRPSGRVNTTPGGMFFTAVYLVIRFFHPSYLVIRNPRRTIAITLDFPNFSFC